MEQEQQIELRCYTCKRVLGVLFMNTLDDLCCLSMRCSICNLKSIEWKQSKKTADKERAEIWRKVVEMNKAGGER